MARIMLAQGQSPAMIAASLAANAMPNMHNLPPDQLAQINAMLHAQAQGGMGGGIRQGDSRGGPRPMSVPFIPGPGNPAFRSKLCKFHRMPGGCRNGVTCTFMHDES